jgi:hypothetical protein
LLGLTLAKVFFALSLRRQELSMTVRALVVRLASPLAMALLSMSAATVAVAQTAAAPAATAEATPVPPAPQLTADDPDPWPRVFENDRFSVRLFPPQVDSWNGSRLEVHSALEVVEKGKESPLYGVVSFAARTRIDKGARMVVIDELTGLSASFPSHPDKQKKLLDFLDKQFATKVKVVSLDRLEAALAVSDAQPAGGVANIENRPPKFVFAERPTVLVSVDGEPVWRSVSGTTFKRLLNTRPLVLRSAESCYLKMFDGWLAAPDLAGPWTVVKSSPSGLDWAMQVALKAQSADLLAGGGAAEGELDEEGKPVEAPSLAKGPVPVILVATEPTELMVFDGPAKWSPVAGTLLEYVENTGGNLFRLAGVGVNYVLVSGRWFQATSLDGPWRYVPQAELSEEFARIPDDSPKENVKASVAGTAQAREAVIANSIPETAEVKRAEAKFTARIDGEPQWKPVDAAHPEPTAIAYVVNSPTPILRVRKGAYYALDRGVWFVAKEVSGPWVVAIDIPSEIYAIPASSPVHYVTYARVYASTPTEVTVGYTPGYYGTVVSEEVVVYGTGYDYSPWVGNYWYGYPGTYGSACAGTYTPWGGWAYTCGVGWAWGVWGGWYAPYYGPYWGGYYGWYGGMVVGAGGGWAAWGPGGWAGTTGNIYRQWGTVSTVSRYSGGYNAWTGNAWRAQSGAAYNSRTGGIAAGQRGAVANVYTGNYAYGGRAAGRTGEGNLVGGSRVTVGDAGNGSVTAGRVGGYNPATGEGGSAGWVRGEQGGVARVGDDFYGTKDGNVYKRDGAGDWSQVERSGQWNNVRDQGRVQDLNRQYSGRTAGAHRYSGQRMSRGGGGGRRR